MIFLIDDNRRNQQEKLFKADYLFDESFKSILNTEYKVRLIDYKILEGKLENASVILLHNTFADADENYNYLDNSRRIRDSIEDLAEDESIPLVLFSGRISQTTFDNQDNPIKITGINKQHFYSNLFFFLQHYKETNQVELKILAYGNEYKIYEALNYLETIIASLQQYDDYALFDVKLLDLDIFDKFYVLSKSQKTLDDFLSEQKNNNLSISSFTQKLNKIKESLIEYGENIYD